MVNKCNLGKSPNQKPAVDVAPSVNLMDTGTAADATLLSDISSTYPPSAPSDTPRGLPTIETTGISHDNTDNARPVIRRGPKYGRSTKVENDRLYYLRVSEHRIDEPNKEVDRIKKQWSASHAKSSDIVGGALDSYRIARSNILIRTTPYQLLIPPGREDLFLETFRTLVEYPTARRICIYGGFIVTCTGRSREKSQPMCRNKNWPVFPCAGARQN